MSFSSMPNIPTDKSYKFQAIGGAFLATFCFWSVYAQYTAQQQSLTELAEISGEAEAYATVLKQQNEYYNSLVEQRKSKDFTRDPLNILGPTQPSPDELQAKLALEKTKEIALPLFAKQNSILEKHSSSSKSGVYIVGFLSGFGGLGIFLSVSGFNKWAKTDKPTS